MSCAKEKPTTDASRIAAAGEKKATVPPFQKCVYMFVSIDICKCIFWNVRCRCLAIPWGHWSMAVWLAGCLPPHNHYPDCSRPWPSNLRTLPHCGTSGLLALCFRNGAAYVSFGGLLMRLQGDPNNLHGFEVDNHVYLLLKKLAF
ncbi:hypothetical protein CEXT_695921 [Caerostris extrusa]|uniref:DNA-directed RNA polymerases I, II, and III subunit RPABC3 n=1 Tax=Caerostris extrusa TaxID=172846 RepID=A0AAV4M7L5_CAEEX|nr:hypothetical protein CEXT_695921 [Caerostris extrusa]